MSSWQVMSQSWRMHAREGQVMSSTARTTTDKCWDDNERHPNRPKVSTSRCARKEMGINKQGHRL